MFHLDTQVAKNFRNVRPLINGKEKDNSSPIQARIIKSREGIFTKLKREGAGVQHGVEYNQTPKRLNNFIWTNRKQVKF